MADIDSQVVKSYNPGDPAGTGAFQEELKNQQLNDALSSGTVDQILMKSGYGAVYDHHVAIKKDLAAFITIEDVIVQIANTNTYDFGEYVTSKELFIKSNINPAQLSVPTTSHIRRRGEIAVDNFDGSLYLLGEGGTAVVKVDAGTVNGFVVERDVLAGSGGDAMLSRDEIRTLINSAFTYDAPTNSLTIRAV